MTMYQLNSKAARKADSEARITEPGAYVGQITLAEPVVASKGTRGIELSFKSNDGAEAKFLTLWTYSAQGEEIFGFSQLCALMTCLKVREISSTKMQVKKYIKEIGHEQVVEVDVFKDLMNKPIGLVLDKELYLSKTGEQKEKMVYKTSFDPTTKQTCSEILDNKPAERVMKLVASFANRPLQQPVTYKSTTPPPANLSQTTSHQGGSQIDFDDDIPF